MSDRVLTPEQLADAKRLEKIFLRRQDEAKSRGEKLSQEQVAHLCGWKTQANFNSYMKGRKPIGLETAIAMAKALNVSVADISPSLALTYADMPTNSQPVQHILDQIRAFDNVRVDYGDDDDSGDIKIPIYDVYFCCGDDELDTDNFEAMLERYVPVISWVAAGDMTPVMSATLTEVISWAPRLTHLSDMAFGLVVRGRSMLPEFKPDDVIYVEPTFDPSNLRDGDLVVVACDSDGEATFKQLVFGDNANDVYLKPLNPDWHNQEIRPMCECRLVGRVMGKYVVY